MSSLLPLLDQLRHTLHRNPSLLHPLPERPLPVLALDPLALTRALHPETVLYSLLLLDLRMLQTQRHQTQDVMLLRGFEELGLTS